ncbi:bacteriohemerythrin [Vallitalea okinawensis]|uniref:bacteriohemerythrin n=1 Tax=Vallitalea okinawensis TaxID=2078660 RepID=UPI000CFBF295|nr:hemerythrin family protein [Vallitalea okinawensis]
MATKLDEKYVLGIDEIDEQHGELVSIGNKLLSLLELDDSIDRYDDIVEILNELREYTRYHFEREEELFGELDYPNKDVHIMEHEFFMKKVDKFFDKDIDENQKENLKELTNFVMGWVLHHILNTDNEYAEIILNA